MKKNIHIFLLFCISLLLANCENPVPVLTSITPDTKIAHLPTFTLTAIGTGFIASSKIVLNGIEKVTTYDSSTELTCEVNPNEIASGPMTIPVLVRTPSPGGGDSNMVNLTVVPDPDFIPAQTFANNPAISCSADLTFSPNGNFVVTWTEDNPPEIVFKKSTDGGSTWDPQVTISNNIPLTYGSAIDSSFDNSLCVVWRSEPLNNYEIYFSRSTDNGSTWSTPQNISNNTKLSEMPRVAIDNSGSIFVVWWDFTPGQNDIFFTSSFDNGSSWTTIMNLSNNWGNSVRADITIDDNSGNLFVVWSDNSGTGISELYLSRSPDQGNSWTTPIPIAPGYTANDSKITADIIGNLHVVWQDMNYIYYIRSNNMGINWTTPQILSIPTYTQRWPAVAVDSAGNVNVVWIHEKYERRASIYYRRSINNGNTWGPRIHVHENIGLCYRVGMDVDKLGYVHLIWEDGAGNLPPTPCLLYYSHSTE